MRPFRSLAAAGIMLLVPGATHVRAEPCQAQLRHAQPGLISSTAPARPERVSSREALALLGARGELSIALPIRRRIEDFWRFKAPASVRARDLDVQYRVNGMDAQAGVMRHTVSEDDGFSVRLRPIAPRVLCADGGYRIFSGGFELRGTARDIGRAGSYAMIVDVDIRLR